MMKDVCTNLAKSLVIYRYVDRSADHAYVQKFLAQVCVVMLFTRVYLYILQIFLRLL